MKPGKRFLEKRETRGKTRKGVLSATESSVSRRGRREAKAEKDKLRATNANRPRGFFGDRPAIFRGRNPGKKTERDFRGASPETNKHPGRRRFSGHSGEKTGLSAAGNVSRGPGPETTIPSPASRVGTGSGRGPDGMAVVRPNGSGRGPGAAGVRIFAGGREFNRDPRKNGG
jgi:hypothetical protein